MLKKLHLGVMLLIICLAVAVSGCTSSSVKVVVNYTGSWNGTITDSSGTRTIEGTGDKTFELGSVTGTVTAKVQKKDNSSDTLTVSTIRGDKVVESMETFAPEGYTSTNVYLTA